MNNKHEQYHKALEQAQMITGSKGKRRAQQHVENILDYHDLKYSIAKRPTYTVYYVVVNPENGGCRTLFISYNSSGKVVKVHG